MKTKLIMLASTFVVAGCLAADREREGDEDVTESAALGATVWPTCTGAAMTPEKMLARFEPGTAKARLGRFRTFARTRHCVDATGCGPWRSANSFSLGIPTSHQPTRGVAWFELPLEGEAYLSPYLSTGLFSLGLVSDVQSVVGGEDHLLGIGMAPPLETGMTAVIIEHTSNDADFLYGVGGFEGVITDTCFALTTRTSDASYNFTGSHDETDIRFIAHY